MRNFINIMESLSFPKDMVENVVKKLVDNIGADDRSQVTAEYRIDQGGDPYGEDGSEIDPVEFDKWVHDYYRDRVFEAEMKISRLFRNDKMQIWRAITAPADWVPNPEKIGIYWAWKEDAAEAHWGDFSQTHAQWLIHAMIDAQGIDWESTLMQNASPSYEDEKEIRLKPGVVPQILNYHQI